MRIVYWNVSGNFDSKCLDSQFLKYILADAPDIIFASETHINQAESIAISVHGYTVYASEKSLYKTIQGRQSKKTFGGIATLIRNDLVPEVRRMTTSIGEQSQLYFNQIRLCGVYIPPKDSVVWHDPANPTEQEAMLQPFLCHPSDMDVPTVILGDFNARTSDRSPLGDQNRTSMDLTMDSRGRALLNTCNDFDCIILNGTTPSDRLGSLTNFHGLGGGNGSVVDYGIASSNLHDLDLSVDPPNEWSTHCKIIVTIHQAPPARSNYPVITKAPRQHAKHTLDENGIMPQWLSDIYDEISKGKSQNTEEEGNVKHTGISPDNLKREQVHKENMKNKRAAWKALQSGQTNSNKVKFMEMSRIAARSHKEQLRYRRQRNQQELASLGCPYAYRRSIKNKLKRAANSSLKAQRTLPTISTTQLVEYFRDQLNEELVSENYCSRDDVDRPIDESLFTADDVLRYRNAVNKKAAPGLDEVTAKELVKYLLPIQTDESGKSDGGRAAATSLANILNESILKDESAQWPTTLRKVKLLLIPKPEKKLTEPSSYRPIALESAITKMITLLLAFKVEQKAMAMNLIPPYQSGFQKGRSPMEGPWILRTLAEVASKTDSNLVVAYIDLKGAYDSISRPKLWEKLQAYGFGGPILRTIQRIYRHSSAQINDQTFSFNRGLLQGDPLSPLLFIIYTADIGSFLEKNVAASNLGIRFLDFRIHILIYADDIILIASSLSDLQGMANALEKYTNMNHLQISTAKSKVQILNCSSSNPVIYKNSPIRINNELLECVDKFKYIGVTFGYGGDLQHHNVTCQKKANHAYYNVLNLQKTVGEIRTATFLKLLLSSVVSVATYGAEISFDSRKNAANRALDVPVRKWLGLGTNHTHRVVLAELGLFPIDLTMLERASSFLMRLRTTENSLAADILRKILERDYPISWIKSLRAKIRSLCIDDRSLFSSIKLPVQTSRLKHLQTQMTNKIREGYIATFVNYDISQRKARIPWPLLDPTSYTPKVYTNLFQRNRRMFARFRFDQAASPDSYLRNIVGIDNRDHRSCICNPSAKGDIYHLINECPNTRTAYDLFKTENKCESLSKEVIAAMILDPTDMVMALSALKFIKTTEHSWNA